MATPQPEVLAELCVTLPSEGGFALEDLDKSAAKSRMAPTGMAVAAAPLGGPAGVVERTLTLLLADARPALDDVDVRRLERNAAVLAAQIPATALSRLLANAARIPPSLRDIVPVASTTADAILRACPKPALADAVLALDDKSLAAVIARLGASVFPIDVERTWAAVLTQLPSRAPPASLSAAVLDELRAWAEPRLAVADAPRPIAARLASSIASAADDEVPLLSAVFLREPLTGLVDALVVRASSSRSAPLLPSGIPKSARLAAALLASHDPPHAVAEMFQAVVVEDAPFLAAIDHALLDEDCKRELPLLATAWVHHDAAHAVRFEHHCRTVPGGLRAVVDLALALPAPLLSWKMMRALVEVVRVWSFQRKALLDKLDDRMADVVFDILTRVAVPRATTLATPSTFNGARAVRRLAAELVVVVHASGRALSFVDAVKARLLDKKPELEPDLRTLLKPVATWPAPVSPSAPLALASTRLLSADADVVRAAVDELNKLGAAGQREIVDALVAAPDASTGTSTAGAPAHLKILVERAILDDDSGARLLRDDVHAEVRFRVALRLDDHKAAIAAVNDPSGAAASPGAPTWFTVDDLAALAARVSQRSLHLKLARSPHVSAYTKSVWALLSLLHDEPHAADVRGALHEFLAVDDEREPTLRAEVAAALLPESMDAIAPVVLAH